MIATDITTSTAGALNAVSSTFQIENADDFGVQISGTFAGTLGFQVSLDGTNWLAAGVQPVGTTTPTTWVTSSATTGAWVRPAGGLKYARVQMTAYTSGTATITFVGTRHSK
jgi:hypothetical protein